MVDALEAGTVITPSIRLVRPLRAGGMGSVWIAEHSTLRTNVVVKFMAETVARDPANLARFSREAAAASQVKSPHVVQMLDHGVAPNGLPFLVMEYLEGHDLSHELSRGMLNAEQAAHIIEQIARALTRAHEKNIVHRDIKPDNIFLCEVGTGEPFVKLVDFGIAKGVEDIPTVTSVGAMVGTPHYMSPEQMLGKASIDYRTDLWSLGVVAFRSLTGVRPFTGDTLGALAVSIVGGTTPLPSQANPALSTVFDAWFAKACARKPEDRFQSARELADAFWAAVKARTADLEYLERAAQDSFARSSTTPMPVPSRPSVSPFNTVPNDSTASSITNLPHVAMLSQELTNPPPPAQRRLLTVLTVTAVCLGCILGVGVALVLRDRRKAEATASEQVPTSEQTVNTPPTGANNSAGDPALSAHVVPLTSITPSSLPLEISSNVVGTTASVHTNANVGPRIPFHPKASATPLPKASGAPPTTSSSHKYKDIE